MIPQLKTMFQMSVVAMLFVGFTPVTHAYEVHDGPTGIIKYTKEKAFTGYTLFSPTEKNNVTYLINMEGDVVHTWSSPTTESTFSVARLLPDGNLLRLAHAKDVPVNIGGASSVLEEMDWNGNVVWFYKMNNKTEVLHHTFDRMPNGNTLLLGWEKVTHDEIIKMGRNPKTASTEELRAGGLPIKDFWLDFVREIDRSGKTVWEWHTKDHLGKGPDKLDINYTLPAATGKVYTTYDWSHFNTLEYLPKTDQILMNSRNLSEAYIVDKKTGKIVWRWGNPTAYGQGEAPSWYNDGSQQIFGSHHATLLDNGNISIFDNGSERPEVNRSRVIEVDIKTGKIVWEYAANGSNSFFSFRQGAAQRLPNGNTLITSTQHGHLFEVTPDHEVVWEFVSPIITGNTSVGIFSDKEHVKRTPAGAPMPHMFQNMIHRAYRYAPDYPGLKGKKLAPQEYIVKGYPKFFEVWQPLR